MDTYNNNYSSSAEKDEKAQAGQEANVGVYAVQEPVWEDLETTHIGDHGTRRVLVSFPVSGAVSDSDRSRELSR